MAILAAVSAWAATQPSDPAAYELTLLSVWIALSLIGIGAGIAILRNRLYDIDLIISRTLVYGSLTAIVAALYAAVVAIGNRLFISATGQRSDVAYFVTAFVVVRFSLTANCLRRKASCSTALKVEESRTT